MAVLTPYETDRLLEVMRQLKNNGTSVKITVPRFVVVHLKADYVIASIAVNMLGLGLTSYTGERIHLPNI
jgi:hypothetical protein